MPNYLLYPMIFTMGGCGYGALELAWRGHTHWTMMLAGGVSLVAIHLINTRLGCSFIRKSVLSAAFITMMEFFIGCIINIALGMKLWNYADMPFNILGQICLPFSFLWLIASAVGICISMLLDRCFGR